MNRDIISAYSGLSFGKYRRGVTFLSSSSPTRCPFTKFSITLAIFSKLTLIFFPSVPTLPHNPSRSLLPLWDTFIALLPAGCPRSRVASLDTLSSPLFTSASALPISTSDEVLSATSFPTHNGTNSLLSRCCMDVRSPSLSHFGCVFKYLAASMYLKGTDTL